MSTLRPGTTLAARYRLADRATSDLRGVESWTARDAVLDRAVQVAVVEGPAAPFALDSARRAALVADPRITRVLDVGTQGDLSYVVTEQFRGSTLTELVDHGLCDGEQARSIVGEVATALETARQRGVHHLALRPEAVRIDGSRVLLTGLGLDAGVAGADQSDPAATSRADTLDLVALLHYLVTARWAGRPLDAPWLTSGAARPLPATRTDGAPDLPAETPDALAELCRRTLTTGSDDGPRTPGELAEALRPWQTFEQPVAPPAAPGPVRAPVRAPVRTSVHGRGASAQNGPVRVPGGRPGAVAGGAAGAAAVAAAVGAGAPVPPPGGMPPSVPPPGTGGPRAGAGAQEPVPWPQNPTAEMPPWSPAAAAAQQVQGPPSPGTNAPGAMPPGAGPATAGVGAGDSGGGRFDPTWITLVVVALLVVLGLVWALNSVFNGYEPPVQSDGGAAARNEQPRDPAEPAEPKESAAPTKPTPTPTPEVRPVIDSGEALDPEGEAAGDTEGEHPDDAPQAYDGQPETFWFTRTYGSPTYGMKSGVGYAIHLKEKAKVSTIVLDTNDTGGKVEVRATSADKPTDGDVLATASFSSETELSFDATEADTFVLWFPELPQTSGGKNRVEINEILVS